MLEIRYERLEGVTAWRMQSDSPNGRVESWRGILIEAHCPFALLVSLCPLCRK